MKKESSKLPSLLVKFFTRIAGKETEISEALLTILHEALMDGSSCVSSVELGEENAALPESLVLGPPDAGKPLVLAPEGNLYFRRYFEYEQSLAASIMLRANSTYEKSFSPSVEQALRNYFWNKDEDRVREDQMAAARLAMTRGLSVVTGGPGTGKTYLAVGVIAGLLESDPNLRVALAAPTGKAAQRLRESIENNLAKFPLKDEVKNRFPHDAKTIHRLLRPKFPSIQFRRNADRPLGADLVVVDESSMIDLPLMAKLFEAIKPDARILLLGDADQLAPVEAGAPFASIANYFSKESTQDAFAKLTKVSRFKEDSSIHQFCRLVQNSQSADAISFLETGEKTDFRWHQETQEKHLAAIAALVKEGYGGLRQSNSPEEAMAGFLGFQILCATNHGPLGVNALNKWTEKTLGFEELAQRQKGRYSGLPILIESNDYSLHLFNGDFGVLFSPSGKPADLLAWFPREDGSLRSVSPARLPRHRPAYAMTIHRSQGSEYKEIAVVLPDRESEILNRNLLYVAVSRASKKVDLFASQDILAKAIETPARLGSGLEFRLNELAES